MKVMKFALSVISILFTLSINKVYGQDEEFKMVPDSEIVDMYIDFSGDGFGIRIVNLPDEIVGYGLHVQNLKGTCSGSKKIEGRQFFLDIKGNYSRVDTFVVYLISHDWKLQYPAEVFTLFYSTSHVKLGANSYILNCVPDNDPWMPTAYSPFLFPQNGYYINPKNGKIKKGSRLINSGKYSSCDLEFWRYISPYGIYMDHHGKQFRGSELIAKGKIEVADWNLEVFHLYWYR